MRPVQSFLALTLHMRQARFGAFTTDTEKDAMKARFADLMAFLTTDPAPEGLVKTEEDGFFAFMELGGMDSNALNAEEPSVGIHGLATDVRSRGGYNADQFKLFWYNPATKEVASVFASQNATPQTVHYNDAGQPEVRITVYDMSNGSLAATATRYTLPLDKLPDALR